MEGSRLAEELRVSTYNGHAIVVNVGSVMEFFFQLSVLVLGPVRERDISIEMCSGGS